jgi:hypothetical protein
MNSLIHDWGRLNIKAKEYSLQEVLVPFIAILGNYKLKQNR